MDAQDQSQIVMHIAVAAEASEGSSGGTDLLPDLALSDVAQEALRDDKAVDCQRRHP